MNSLQGPRSPIAPVPPHITAIERPGSRVLIIAPHGGRIEVGTSELAALIAADEHNLFSFEGLKPRGHNRELHITSRCFEPKCRRLGLGLGGGDDSVTSRRQGQTGALPESGS